MSKVKVKKILTIAIIMSIFSFITSCFSGNPGIVIVDTENSNIKFISSSKYGKFICNVNREKKYFKTLRDVNEKTLALRTINFDGKIISKQLIPMFIRAYGEKYLYIFSPNGEKIIFIHTKHNRVRLENEDFKTDVFKSELRSYNIKTKDDKLLYKNISSNGYSIMEMHFISNNELILLLRDDEKVNRIDYQVAKFNIETKKFDVIYNAEEIDDHFSKFSYNEKFLTIKKDQWSRNIDILNLDTGNIIAKINSASGKASVKTNAWNPNNIEVAYSDGDYLYTYNIKKKNSEKNSKIIDGDDQYCLFLKYLNEDAVICVINYRNKTMKCTLKIVSLKDKKIIKEFNNVELNGDLYVVNDGKKIIAEVGF